MHYLLRLAEAGREAQAPRSRIRPDVLAVIAERLPQVRTESWVGRVLVESERDVAAVLADIHGVMSVSPCRIVELAELPAAIDALAAQVMPGASSFRVAVKRSGEHAFSSHEKAAELGARVGRAYPQVGVDLNEPDVTLGVEIRDDTCYVYSRVITGLDWRAQPLPAPGDWPRFLVDQMLGRLVPWLRLLGFDTITVLDEADAKLQRVARADNRVLLTKDFELSQSQAVNVHFVDADEPLEQIAEVLAAYTISPEPARMFTRCTLCNADVELVDKAAYRDHIPAAAYEAYDEFSYCKACDKVYWKGAQYERILEKLAELEAND